MLSENPEFVFEMLQAHPKFKAMMDRNPQFRHALSDPSTLRDLLRTQSDPRAMQETMRGHDRALAQIENIPGGFQQLQQIYETDLKDVIEGFDSLEFDGGEGGRDRGVKKYETGTERNTQPMPNPWRRPQPTGPNILARPMINEQADLTMYERRYSAQLQTMREMGFTDARTNIRALLATGGNVGSAIEFILNSQGHFQ